MKAAPILRSSSCLASTAVAAFSSRSMGFCAARIMCLESQNQSIPSSSEKSKCFGGRGKGKKEKASHARSVLLNLALLVSILGLPLRASCRISAPMPSPSRSQSVHMNSACALRACDLMLSAIGCFSCDGHVNRKLIPLKKALPSNLLCRPTAVWALQTGLLGTKNSSSYIGAQNRRP